MRFERTSFTALLLTVTLAGAALVGCGDKDQSLTGGLVVRAAWARTSPSVANAGAAYVSIDNGTDAADALVAARVDASVAKATEIHETVMVQADSTDSSMTAGTSGAPVMEMRPVARIEVPPRSSVVFKPGGYHMMLMELSKPLQLGSSFQLTLTFERAGDKVVTVDVRDVAP